MGYIFGKTKVAPVHGHTISRLELCAAVLAVEVAEVVAEFVGLSSEKMFFTQTARLF